MNLAEPLLSIKNLSVTTCTLEKPKAILEDVAVTVFQNQVVALVGGSGSGKTTTGLAILRLLPAGLVVTAGSIWFSGQNILTLPENQMRRIRGGKIAMVFQEPLYAFNPVFQIGYQVAEVLREHTALSPSQSRERVNELLRLVGLPDPKRVATSYPHQLSGGMRQRCMIAQAIAADPQLVIADEPTSNLDVTIQARILALFRDLRRQLNLSFLLITHDLGVVAHLADEVVVLAGGKVIEGGRTAEIFAAPKEKYTQQLLAVL